MNALIGQLLPLAVGIAISPIPVIAVILTLLSPRAKTISSGFATGWVIGIILTVVAFTALSSFLPTAPEADRAHPIRGIIMLALGVLLLVAAVGQWRQRPQPGETGTMPAWMTSIGDKSFAGAFGLGLLLSTVNPKNLMLGIAAGVALGDAALEIGPTVIAVTIYTVIGAATVLGPVIAYLVATEKLTGPLNRLREWLAQYNAVIMGVLFVMLSVNLIGSGLQSF